ncbi:DUF4189 domain-containing protein [Nocardia yamanashiensis]|uniref:DUF4189 domain-containing protein n=1 Tax=Nocardia yamanashiensis TaxID=209247 RepID=UPI00082E066A|nr:DUF4189 domain-containing protein [Nocardia yamanashiensis]UGT43271.1 DUF4189 domain-containing protein [Nocardia yamanashiensis]
MSLLRKAGMGLAVTSMAAIGTVAAGPAKAAEADGPVFTAASGDLNGSLALSRSTRNVAYAVNYTKSGDADADALRQCGGGDCEVVVRFTNACGAVTADSNGAFGYAWAPTKVEAEKAATDVLGNKSFPDVGSASGRNTKVIVSVCTDNAR